MSGHYHRKQIHKKRMKEKYCKTYFYGRKCQCSWNYFINNIEPKERIKYWDFLYLSGPRQYAKYATNRKIRAKYRNVINIYNIYDIETLRGADYRKLVDYDWTVW